jgi:hypothetical protein
MAAQQTACLPQIIGCVIDSGKSPNKSDRQRATPANLANGVTLKMDFVWQARACDRLLFSHFARVRQHSVDQAILLGFFGVHEDITIRVLFNPFDRLTGVVA